MPIPPNPKACRTLTDEEFGYLKRQDPNLWSSPSKTCKTCNKKSPILIINDSGETEEVVCPCKEQWRLHLWLLWAGISLRYQRLGWKDATHVNPDAKRAVMEWVESSEAHLLCGNGLTLWSKGKGSGKTLLSTLVSKYLMSAGHNVFFVLFSDLIDKAQDGWRDKESREWFERRIRNAPVLVMDDVGREYDKRSELIESMLDPIIRWRVANEKPTIITTNLDPTDMKSRYGGNILSLLDEINTVIEVNGQDFRPQVREQKIQDVKRGIQRPITIL